MHTAGVCRRRSRSKRTTNLESAIWNPAECLRLPVRTAQQPTAACLSSPVAHCRRLQKEKREQEDDRFAVCDLEPGLVPAPGQLVAWDLSQLPEATRKADGSFLELLPKSDCRPVQVLACCKPCSSSCA